MDSPGHVDFSYEVYSALRLSDGAIVVVDVVEGVSPQTKTVLRQAWNEKVKTVLILNKIDRLVLELNMEAKDIKVHLRKIVEDVNIVISSFI
jgi:ribosome assembly protein 1